jgi:hypothetical protein
LSPRHGSSSGCHEEFRIYLSVKYFSVYCGRCQNCESVIFNEPFLHPDPGIGLQIQIKLILPSTKPKFRIVAIFSTSASKYIYCKISRAICDLLSYKTLHAYLHFVKVFKQKTKYSFRAATVFFFHICEKVSCSSKICYSTNLCILRQHVTDGAPQLPETLMLAGS